MKLITWRHRLAIFGTTLLMIGVFALIGYAVGRWVGNWKLFLVLGVLISYPFTQWFFLWQLRKKSSKSPDKQ